MWAVQWSKKDNWKTSYCIAPWWKFDCRKQQPAAKWNIWWNTTEIVNHNNFVCGGFCSVYNQHSTGKFYICSENKSHIPRTKISLLNSQVADLDKVWGCTINSYTFSTVGKIFKCNIMYKSQLNQGHKDELQIPSSHWNFKEAFESRIFSGLASADLHGIVI